MRVALAAVLLVGLSAPTTCSQRASGPDPEPLEDPRADLGKLLFGSALLGDDGRTSCATCHDPARSLTDGRADARGQMGIGTGRNTPTLFRIGLIERFRDPAQAQTARARRRPRVLTLEERCLEPLRNELEMGSGVRPALRRLNAEPGLPGRFDEAFGGPRRGATADRLGSALAAFLRTLGPPETPFGRHLGGAQDALLPDERRGLATFEARGRCAACHSGPALSDGLMHVVDPPDGQRMLDRQRAAVRRRVKLLSQRLGATGRDSGRPSPEALAEEATRRARELPGGGGYDPDQLEVQTTTLWDVARTGPYFRDGSVRGLAVAVRVHVSEIREVAARPRDVARALRRLAKQGKRSPRPLRPPRPRTKDGRVPAALDEQEIADLVAFLGALSPRRR